MPFDAERIRERQRDAPVGPVRDRRGAAHGLLRGRRIPHVALEVGDSRARDQCLVDVALVELRARAQEGAHCALGVGCDDHEATSGRCAGDGEGRLEMHAHAAQVVREDLAEGVVGHPADVRRAPAERRDSKRGVRGRPAGSLGGRPHLRVDLVGPGLVDHGHRPALDTGAGDEFVVGEGEHVDQRIADGQYVEPSHFLTPRASATGCGSGGCSSTGRSRRPTVCVRPYSVVRCASVRPIGSTIDRNSASSSSWP